MKNINKFNEFILCYNQLKFEVMKAFMKKSIGEDNELKT